MEPGSSETPRELDDLSPLSVVDFGTEKASPVSRSSTPQERPKVRFNSKVDLPALAAETAAEPSGEQRRPASSKPQVLRPALSRNPSSYNSAASDIGDEPLSPQKRASAAAAAERARAVALDTWHHSNSPNSRRWSIESDAVTDASYSEVPIANSYASPQAHDHASSNDQNAKPEVEAEGLLKAHTRNLGNVWQNISAGNSSQPELDTGIIDGAHVSSGNGRGGVFYQLLQAYRNPISDNPPVQHHRSYTGEASGSSGATTPTRRKWYEHEKANRSQETIARLAGASMKLANPSGTTSAASSPPSGVRKRPPHKRTTSGRIMSMMGLNREEEVKITIHVADILKRQKYIVKMCRALMLFGAPTHRLEEYLAMSARVLEIDSQFLYIPNCMIISFDDVFTHTTEVKIVRTAQSVNLSKLKDVHAIYKEVLHDIISLDDALSRLDQVISAKPLYPVWVCVLMYGFASAAVSCFFSARLLDLPIIFALGILLGFLQLVVAPRSNTYNTVFEVSATILLSFLARAFGSIRNGELFCFSAITQGSIAMILPGWLVLSSALELHSKAMVPGAIRLVYSIIYSLFLIYGITVGTALYGAIDSNAVMETTCHKPLDPYWNFLFVPLYVIFVTFTVQARWTQMPAMVVIGLAGYTVNFFTSKKFAASPSIAYTFGAFAIGVLANLYSRIRHGVAAAVLLPAVYLQVPGSLASTGAITSGLVIAANLTNSDKKSSDADNTALNAAVFNVAASMIQIAIGITVGLLMSALIVYPTGKKRSGLWTL
ncbi:hypothetical protein F5B22DRAFT_582015 [Xylaria bambusicola]|uniref:uncharacterized protein n=1 Tax=Xylaria bambusicola TaxID=326684 RepID=UPI0020089BB1|nr:uncharacterized protein F5B22DRAFT_582015 [Xylaria bambusicola]KAI0527715.1 hypothetical protein F5B22DRAFT_582015 [Xylaria bambusicola]